MRRFAMMLAVVLAALPTVAHASASPQAIAVLDVESAWLKAVANHDPVALGKILDDAFVHVNYKGAVEYRADELARVKKGVPYSETTSEQTVNFVGGVAIVSGVNVIRQGGKIVLRLRYTDTYRSAGKTWRAVWAQETPISK